MNRRHPRVREEDEFSTIAELIEKVEYWYQARMVGSGFATKYVYFFLMWYASGTLQTTTAK